MKLTVDENCLKNDWYVLFDLTIEVGPKMYILHLCL